MLFAFRAEFALLMSSNHGTLDRIFEMMIASENPAFFKEMSDSFVSTSCAVRDVAVTRVSAANARTKVSRSRDETIIN